MVRLEVVLFVVSEKMSRIRRSGMFCEGTNKNIFSCLFKSWEVRKKVWCGEREVESFYLFKGLRVGGGLCIWGCGVGE